MIRGVIFDINGTVIDILTNEGEENIYRVLSNFLDSPGNCTGVRTSSGGSISRSTNGNAAKARRSIPSSM